MAYFTLDTSTMLTLQNSLIAAMQASGMSPSVLYQSGGTLVWTFNRSAKVQKMTLNNDNEKRPAFFYGDSHTGGGNLSNAITVTSGTPSDAFGYWWFVTNSDACAIVIKGTGNTYATMFWAKSGTNAIIGFLDSGGWLSSSVRYVPTGAAIFLSGAPYFGSYLLKNSTGTYYYCCDIFVVDSGGRLLHASVDGLKWLCRDRGYVAGLEVYGNDVVLTGGTPDLPTPWVAPTMYMPGGASWAP